MPGRATVVFSVRHGRYNDHRAQVNTACFDPRLARGGIGSLGLHLWNSHPPRWTSWSRCPTWTKGRPCATGARVGSTQTFLLTARGRSRHSLRPRRTMIPLHAGTGTVCENAPNLRLDTPQHGDRAINGPRRCSWSRRSRPTGTRGTSRIEVPERRERLCAYYAAEKRTWPPSSSSPTTTTTGDSRRGRWLLRRGCWPCEHVARPRAGVTARRSSQPDLLVSTGGLPRGEDPRLYTRERGRRESFGSSPLREGLARGRRAGPLAAPAVNSGSRTGDVSARPSTHRAKSHRRPRGCRGCSCGRRRTGRWPPVLRPRSA